MKKEKKYNYFYKITNNINNHFYYGIHSTDNLNDGYMGSGSRLHAAYKKYGIENFSKDILKYFDTREECAQYEAEAVTEQLVLDNNCYNISCGGEYWNTLNSVPVIDISTGKQFRCSKSDPNYISGQYVFNLTGCTVVYDSVTNKNVLIPVDQYKSNKDRYKHISKNYIISKDIKTNKIMRVSYKDFQSNENYVGLTKNKVLVKDKNNSAFLVDINDERLINGELTYFWKGRKHTEETKNKIKNTMILQNHQKGEKNSQYGTCWIYNDVENKKIQKSDLDNYISLGWKQGRRIKK